MPQYHVLLASAHCSFILELEQEAVAFHSTVHCNSHGRERSDVLGSRELAKTSAVEIFLKFQALTAMEIATDNSKP